MIRGAETTCPGWLDRLPGRTPTRQTMRTDPQREILAYLLKGGRLTVKTAWKKFGTSEFRRIVSRLKKKGYKFGSRWMEGTTPDGRQVRFKEHFLIL